MNIQLSVGLLFLSFLTLAASAQSTGHDRMTEVGEGRTFFAGLRTGFLVTILSALPLKMTVLIILALILYGSFYAIRKMLSVVSFQYLGRSESATLVQEELEAITRIARAITSMPEMESFRLPESFQIPDRACRARAICEIGEFLNINYPTVASVLSRVVSTVSLRDIYTTALLQGVNNVTRCDEGFRECTTPMTPFSRNPVTN